jgi:hypothetical protein
VRTGGIVKLARVFVAVAVAVAASLAACATSSTTGMKVATGAVPTITAPATTTSTTAPPPPTTTATTRAPSTAPARPRTTSAPRPVTTRRAVTPAPAPSGSGTVAAFYYGWYGGPVGPSHYHPVVNPYDMQDLATVKKQIEQMRYAGIQAGIASWWGPGHQTDKAFAVDLAAAEGTPFKWALYYEPEGPDHPNLPVDQLRASLQYLVDHYMNHPNYLRVDGKPVIFVWPDTADRCEMVARWNQANTLGLHVVQKRFPGYSSCVDQPQSWHDYSPDHFSIEVRPWSYSIGPGFWHYAEGAPRLGRNPANFEAAARSMAASSAMWKLVTTFNEWGEGTAIEPAAEWASPSGYGVYLDILHNVLGTR